MISKLNCSSSGEWLRASDLSRLLSGSPECVLYLLTWLFSLSLFVREGQCLWAVCAFNTRHSAQSRPGKWPLPLVMLEDTFRPMDSLLVFFPPSCEEICHFSSNPFLPFLIAFVFFYCWVRRIEWMDEWHKAAIGWAVSNEHRKVPRLQFQVLLAKPWNI
jgi:hypothetical protein